MLGLGLGIRQKTRKIKTAQVTVEFAAFPDLIVLPLVTTHDQRRGVVIVLTFLSTLFVVVPAAIEIRLNN
jgi:hypothetical protein